MDFYGKSNPNHQILLRPSEYLILDFFGIVLHVPIVRTKIQCKRGRKIQWKVLLQSTTLRVTPHTRLRISLIAATVRELVVKLFAVGVSTANAEREARPLDDGPNDVDDLGLSRVYREDVVVRVVFVHRENKSDEFL